MFTLKGNTIPATLNPRPGLISYLALEASYILVIEILLALTVPVSLHVDAFMSRYSSKALFGNGGENECLPDSTRSHVRYSKVGLIIMKAGRNVSSGPMVTILSPIAMILSHTNPFRLVAS